MRKQNYGIVFILFFITIGLSMEKFGHEDKKLSYPAIYSKDLPRYPNAKLISTGRQTSSLRDGLKLKLISPDKVMKIIKYYKKGLKESGWTFPKERPYQNPKMYMGKFTKEDLYFLLSVSRFKPDQKETEILISYAKD